MTAKKNPQELRELVRTFEAVRSLHERLLAVLNEKLEAMRSANVAALLDSGREEQELVQDLREREIYRATLMQSVARERGLPAREARKATVSQIGELLPGAERELLLHAAQRLQAAVAQTAQVNRIAASIARGVTGHMKSVFSALRPAGNQPVGYTRRGESFVAGAAIMDVVG